MKVMVSLPEDTVRQLDQLAEREGTSRSAVIRELAEGAARDDARRRAKDVTSLYREPQRRGGDALEAVKQARHSR